MEETLKEIVKKILSEEGDQFLQNYKEEKELKENLIGFSKRFWNSVKFSLSINQEIDFAGLEKFVLNDHFQELKESCELQESEKKQYRIESFCARAFENVSADQKGKKEIVSSYITVIMKLVEQFYIRRNEKETLVLAEKTKNEIVKDVVREIGKRLDSIEKNFAVALPDSSKAETREKLQIRSFPPKEGDSEVDHLWDFSDRFQDERFLKKGCSWDEIYREIQEKANKLDKTKVYEVDFKALFSIAFMAGRTMDSISDIKSIPCQNIFPECADSSTKADEEGEEWEPVSCEKIEEGQNDFAVIISLTRPIKNAVERYIKEKGLSIGEIYHFSIQNPDNKSVKTNKHLEELVKKVNQCINNRWDENEKGTLHLFISGLAEFMFELGKRSRMYKNVQIYEYNNKGLEQYPKPYYLGWKMYE